MIRLSKSCLGKEEQRAVVSVLEKEFLGMGDEVQKFEHELSQFFGRPVVCVVNGTAALHLALQAAGVRAGDEVLVPSLTYVASFQAISATGAIPIACDINEKTLTLDYASMSSRVTNKTKAVMPVHYSGGVGDLCAIYDFAKKHKLRVIEDAAHAFGTEYRGERIGSFGDISCFSFDGIKNITSGEGGCIVSGDERIIAAIKDSRLLGVEKDTEKRFSGQRSWEVSVSRQGWRYHMSNIMAAIGIEQLKKFPQMADKRQKLAKKYDSLLIGNEYVQIIHHNYDEVVPHIYVIRIESMDFRDLLRDELLKLGIQTGVHWQPNHQLDFYAEHQVGLPTTEKIYPHLLTLPLHPDLSDEDVEYICKNLLELIKSNNGK
ncbi:DegT/DnrJ/EryC1/StrS family aminotransferase [Polynucleobacter paneuropaeus]|jgi:dTDP-4-amino-4,6-dideoxygalactose transaminase|nr:DegT/DnrJ/EryC1/StrS family aminotransferase [Polynucleobacter paneuropaeus]MBT8576699.1 DegT/DnrJ/EryC1/StrS family aminotransferase [Polynucleobacter paneuropaeus]MBT8615092.1 DegT/DnrJ/EryC1/StrS family aminotransferase [Polynucleobacter paneuropaeus]MBT8616573.1 DegT/DnrJ/EryC1/StrS family aminotransferase [Polynucleobacter paneuropaeus]MBT8618454.1 DegT/DnrJ/EryC1/StrS family aminotransferase [Polynucleobacter paneuropaeus]